MISTLFAPFVQCLYAGLNPTHNTQAGGRHVDLIHTLHEVDLTKERITEVMSQLEADEQESRITLCDIEDTSETLDVCMGFDISGTKFKLEVACGFYKPADGGSETMAIDLIGLWHEDLSSEDPTVRWSPSLTHNHTLVLDTDSLLLSMTPERKRAYQLTVETIRQLLSPTSVLPSRVKLDLAMFLTAVEYASAYN